MALWSETAYRFPTRGVDTDKKIEDGPKVQTGLITVDGQKFFNFRELARLGQYEALTELRTRLKECPEGYRVVVYQCDAEGKSPKNIREFSAVAAKPRSDGEFLIRFAKSGKFKEFPITAKSGDQFKCEIEYCNPGRKDIVIDGKKHFQLTDLSEDNLTRLKKLIASAKAGSRVIIYQCDDEGNNQRKYISADAPNIQFGFRKPLYSWESASITLGQQEGYETEGYFSFVIEEGSK